MKRNARLFTRIKAYLAKKRDEAQEAPASSEAIWAIRSSISRLEQAKDKIVVSFGSEFPTVDAKEAYYGAVMAWEQLRGSSESKDKADDARRADNSRWALEAAKSRALQCASALKSQPLLQKEFTEAFDVCYRDISAALDALAPRQKEEPPKDVLVKKGDDEYQVLCSVCGALSWTLRRGKGNDRKDFLKYTGISSGMELNPKDAPALFKLFGRGGIRGAHKYIKDKYSRDYDVMGIDAYCPQCDKTYCALHYGAYEEFDEGFYDCTYGVCPQGHKRLIND